MKDWFWNLWQDIKDDPFEFILELLMALLLIFAYMSGYNANLK